MIKKVHDHIDHIDRFWGETVKTVKTVRTVRTVRTKNVRETLRLLRQPIVGIGFLAARARLFPAKQTKKEPACSVVEQAGILIDRVIGLSRERKGLFYLLTSNGISFITAQNIDIAVLD